MKAEEAAVLQAEAEAERSRLKYESQWEGVNTTVAGATAQMKESEAAQKQAAATVESLKAQLEMARYYLDNTLMVAPEDGYIVNLQVQPGMVSGIYRIGGIASFIVDKDRYLLASFNQETLKYVKVGQPVEVALDLYPGQVFAAKVDSVWWANGEGQYLPSDIIPKFYPADPTQPQGEFAVKIYLQNPSKVGLPIGAQGAAAIYTSGGGFAVLRKITIRMHSWFNWLYPMPF
jgi:multidrug resistance efflux pump